MTPAEPSYQLLSPSSDAAAYVITVGSQGLWIMDILFVPSGGMQMYIVSDVSADGIPFTPLTPLHAGDPAGLSTGVYNPTDLTLVRLVGAWQAPPSLQLKRFYPIYIAPGSLLSLEVGGIVYFSEG